MNVNSIIGSIRKQLQDEFHIPVVTERVEQQPKPPFFFIRGYRNVNSQLINGRFNHMVDIEVRYHPAEIKPCNPIRARNEMNDVSDRLMYLLRIINVGEFKLLAQDLESAESDGVLVMTFNVQITERIARIIDKMEHLDHEIAVMETEHTHIKDKNNGG